MKMIACQAGEFLMGPNTHDHEDFRNGAATIRLSGFLIGEMEVNQSTWEAVSGLDFQEHLKWKGVPHDAPNLGRNLPVFGISYFEALHFCEILTEMARRAGKIPIDKEFRLPTEAEWEYACRSGQTGRFASGDLPPDWANLAAEGKGGLVSIELSGSNHWGIKGMHGNAAEWVLDSFGKFKPGSKDPVNLSYLDIRRPLHVIRGGSFSSSVDAGASGSCTVRVPWWRSQGVGFRIALGKRLDVGPDVPFSSENLIGEGT